MTVRQVDLHLNSKFTRFMLNNNTHSIALGSSLSSICFCRRRPWLSSPRSARPDRLLSNLHDIKIMMIFSGYHSSIWVPSYAIRPHQILTCMSSFSSSMVLSMIVSTPFLSTWVVLRHFLSSSHVHTASTSRYQVKESIHQITFCQFEGLSDNKSLCTSITWSRRSSAKCWFSSNSFRTARKNDTILYGIEIIK